MTTFRLEKSTASTQALAKFNVRNAAGDLVGSINVKPSEENDLRAHWKGAPATSSPRNAASASKQIKAMVAAGRLPDQRAVLRGC